MEEAKVTINQMKKDLREKDNTIRELKNEAKTIERKGEKERKQQEMNENLEVKRLLKQNKDLEERNDKLGADKECLQETLNKMRREIEMLKEEINISAIRNRELREEHENDIARIKEQSVTYEPDRVVELETSQKGLEGENCTSQNTEQEIHKSQDTNSTSEKEVDEQISPLHMKVNEELS